MRFLTFLLVFLSFCFYAQAGLRPVNPHHRDTKNLTKPAPGQITSFTIPQQIAPTIIDQNAGVIGIVVHSGTNLTALKPIITITGTTVSPASGATQNFTSAVVYTVDAATTPVYYNVFVLPARNKTACVGASATITGDTPTPAGNFLWQMLNGAGNWITAPGPNSIISKDYTTPIFSTAGLYTYRRQITTITGSTYDSYYDVTVNSTAPIAGNTINTPAVNAFCASGQPATITGGTPTGGIGTYTYQWQNSTDNVNFSDISGATDATFDPPVLTTTTYYQRVVTSGNCTVPVKGNKVTIKILNAITNNHIFDPATTVFCTRSIGSIINGDIPSGGTGAFQYQWQSCTDGVSFADIPGANATHQDYPNPAVTQTTYYRRLTSSGTCSTLVPSDNVVVITIQPGLSANSISTAGPIAFCVSGNRPVITGSVVTGGNGTPSYQWESSPDGGSYQPIPGAIGQDLAPQPITATTYYRRSVTSGACTIPSPSNIITITVLPVVSNNTITPPPITSFCASGEPDNITGSPPSGGSGNYYYQWQSSVDNINFNDIVGETHSDYAPNNEISATTYYRRRVSSDICTIPQASNVITITVYPAIGLNTITAPTVTSFCVTGNPAEIQGNPPSGGIGSYTIQWQSCTDNIHFTDISGATAASFDPGIVNVTTYYRRTIISGVCDVPSVSSVISITVVPVLANNTITPPSPNAFCANGNSGSIIGRIPTGGDGNYTYQWQQSADNVDAHFTTITGEIGKDLDPPALTSTMFYRRIVNAGVCTAPLVSSAVEIHITPAITANTIQPSPLQYCVSGNPATINGSPDLSRDPRDMYHFQWYSSPDNLTYTIISGATDVDYDPPTITATTYYRRDITSGACTIAVQSIPAKITVNNTPANVIVNPAAPICAGSFTTLSVSSPDPNLTYTWYDSPAKDHSVSAISSFTTDPLSGPTTFYVEASNPGGCSSPVLTSVTVQVNNAPDAPVLVQNPVPVCESTPADLKVLNPQSALIYIWYTTLTGTTQVFTGPEFLTAPINGNITYYVEAKNSTGCLSQRTAVNITTIAAPQVRAQGTSVCPGGTATVTAVGSDPNVIIKWYAAPTGGSSLSSNASFNIPSVNANVTYYAEGSYTNSGCVSVTRSPAQVIVLQPLAAPVVSVQSTTASTITFTWPAVTGASGYLVSINGGQTFNYPSSGSTGTSHTVTGLAIGQSVTVVVRETGFSQCQLSANSIAVTGTTISPLAEVIFVANAFTPNGDGKNDIIYVHNENIKSLKFYVYDQWGQLLYISLSQQNGWDGSYKGKAEPAGVYVYFVEAILNDGKQVNKKGTITLLR